MKSAPKLLRFQVSAGPETKPAIVAVCSHTPVGQHSDRLVPRTKGQINNRAQALGRDYFGVKWAVSVKLIDEVEI